MAPPVRTGPSPSIEGSQGLEFPIEEESVANGIGDTPTTYASASDVVTSLITRCWSAITDGLLTVRRFVSRVITRVWNFITLVVSGSTTAKKLMDFKLSVEALNRAALMHEGGNLEAIDSYMRSAYDSLSGLLKGKISAEAQKMAELTEDEALDIVVMNKKVRIEEIVDGIYRDLPSVMLGNMEVELSRATNDLEQVRVLLTMQALEISPLEPDITDDFLDERMLVSFNGCENSLKEKIYKGLRQQALISRSDLYREGAERHVEIGGHTISLLAPNSGSLLLKSSPRMFLVGVVLFALQRDLEAL